MAFRERSRCAKRSAPEEPDGPDCDHYQWIGRLHTGGNPGRHDIDESQELNYRFIAQAIADLNYTGYISHEYSPAQGHEPIETLKKAMAIIEG